MATAAAMKERAISANLVEIKANTWRTECLARAYNAGSDARLAGEAKDDNPYTDPEMRKKWLEGWDDVNSWWGIDARWPVKVLPFVIRRQA
jgi:ribosome modulation factor